MFQNHTPSRIWQAAKQQPKSTGDNKNKPGKQRPTK